MKSKTIIISLMLLAASIGFAQDEQPHTTKMADKITKQLIVFFDNLLLKNALGIDSLKRLQSSDKLINPISQEESYQSHDALVYHKQIDLLINKIMPTLVDMSQIHEWATTRLRQLEENKATKEHVYEKTTDTHQPMEFVTIPAGTYTSTFDQHEFEIPEDTEIQTAPVTQFQWAEKSDENPSQHKDDDTSATTTIGDKKISMLADHPVESVSFSHILAFIEKMNEQDTPYRYALASVDEYDALLQATLGKNWLTLSSTLNPCIEEDKTCSVHSGNYVELNKTRVWNIIGNIWQFTRSKQSYTTTRSLDSLVFGAAYTTKKEVLNNPQSLLRPITFHYNILGAHLGFRLMRLKKESKQREYHYFSIPWTENDVPVDTNWEWQEKLQHIQKYDATGATGARGATGPTGATGPAGATGPTGFNIALLNYSAPANASISDDLHAFVVACIIIPLTLFVIRTLTASKTPAAIAQ
jgi:formylglycine-generating enzyme required for sulfatase activity